MRSETPVLLLFSAKIVTKTYVSRRFSCLANWARLEKSLYAWRGRHKMVCPKDFGQMFFPKPEQFFTKPLKVFTICWEFFVTNFVTLVTNFLIRVTNFVMLVTNFVTNFFLQDRKKYQAERKIYLGERKKCKAGNLCLFLILLDTFCSYYLKR